MKFKVFSTRMQSEWIIKCQDGLRALRNITIEMVHKKWLNVYPITSKMVSIEGSPREISTTLMCSISLIHFHLGNVPRRWKIIMRSGELLIKYLAYKFRKNYMRQLKTDYETNFKKLAMGLIKKFNMKFISKKHKLGRVTNQSIGNTDIF